VDPPSPHLWNQPDGTYLQDPDATDRPMLRYDGFFNILQRAGHVQSIQQTDLLVLVLHASGPP
jgi:hypothetical protein